MTTPGTYSFTIIKNVDFEGFQIRFKTDGAPIDLTGWEVFAEARLTPDGPLAFDLNPSISEPTGGVVTIPPKTAEATAAMYAGDFGWDLVMKNPAGHRLQPWITGRVSVPWINTHI